jgi:tRNA(Met) C34 N-acetyltransferase TmcA
MHDTEATTMTSRRVSRAAVAECRNRSISSLMLESFSMYVSVDAM